jgi:hypothetical protein
VFTRLSDCGHLLGDQLFGESACHHDLRTFNWEAQEALSSPNPVPNRSCCLGRSVANQYGLKNIFQAPDFTQFSEVLDGSPLFAGDRPVAEREAAKFIVNKAKIRK